MNNKKPDSSKKKKKGTNLTIFFLNNRKLRNYKTTKTKEKESGRETIKRYI